VNEELQLVAISDEVRNQSETGSRTLPGWYNFTVRHSVCWDANPEKYETEKRAPIWAEY